MDKEKIKTEKKEYLNEDKIKFEFDPFYEDKKENHNY